MRSRILFLGIAAFWVLMNFLLWRSQWEGQDELGNEVPVAIVWQRLLTAPDTSHLDILDHGKRIGFCHWTATVGNSPLSNNRMLEQDYAPDEVDQQITGYTLSLEGNTGLNAVTNRASFNAHLSLTTNQDWKDFSLRVTMKPNSWEIYALASSQKVTLKVNEAEGSWTRAFSFSDLQNPEMLLENLGGSYLGGIAGLTTGSLGGGAQAPVLKAHDDRMKIGHLRVRVYRLETRMLGQPIEVFINRAGEILKVELPNQITLRNEAISHF